MFQDLRERLLKSATAGGYVDGGKVAKILDEEIKSEPGRDSPDHHQGKHSSFSLVISTYPKIDSTKTFT